MDDDTDFHMSESQDVEQAPDDNIRIAEQYRAPNEPIFDPNVLRRVVSLITSALTAQDIYH